jgi:hypothetical protein
VAWSGAAAVLVACGGHATSVSKAALIRSQERAGVQPALATCIANAATVELNPDELRTFAANPSNLPTALSQHVTKLAADCAVEVAPAPSTTPSLPHH